jgi:uridine kinase
MKTADFHPAQVQTLVFDLDSLTGEFSQEQWESFREFLRILQERDFHLVLLGEEVSPSDWQQLSGISVVSGSPESSGRHNPQLGQTDHFWVTDRSNLHAWLQDQSIYFASRQPVLVPNGFYCSRIEDLLQIFHPSHNTTIEIAEQLLKSKQEAPSKPLLVGISGPDDCGHAYFVGELLETLEEQGVLVSGFDLLELLSPEYKNLVTADYWRSSQERDWILDTLLRPYAAGESVAVIDEPDFLQGCETSSYPLFWASEMVVLLWGTTIFVPGVQELLDVKIVLDLTPKAAAARLFQLDERSDFNPDFVETYLKGEGRLYSEYLEANQIQQQADFVVQFDNFHAFKLRNDSKQ